MRACGNPECGVSTGIHEGLTFGWGELDQHGFWQYPCRRCAEEHDRVRDAIRNDVYIDLVVRDGMTFAEADAYVAEADWINLPAWPEEDAA